MNLNKWADKWDIPWNAVEDLRIQMGTVDHKLPPVDDGVSETAVSSRVRLDASRKGMWLMRNNVGAVTLENGRVIRYGLANVSKQQNKIFKSSDLIGVKPIVITHAMLGHTIGQFMARETKPEGWQYTNTKHEIAQRTFLNRVVALGADARFTNGEDIL